MRIRLAGPRGEALEGFWAGRLTAHQALAVERGLTVPAAKPAPKACWLCDGMGQVVTCQAAEARRSSGIVDGPVQAERAERLWHDFAEPPTVRVVNTETSENGD